MKKRLCIAVATAAFGFLSGAAALAAETYPNRPVRMIVPFGVGGSTDVLVRIIATRLPEALGEQVVIDNRTGAGGLIGTEMVAKAPADGYTLLATGSPHSIFPHLYKSVPFDPLNSFAPIMQIASQPYGLVVHPSLPVKSAKDLIALAKKEPGKYDYASSGQGGAMHLFQAMFASMAQINMVHVPYKGSDRVRAELLGGQVKIGCLGLSSILPHHRAGQLRIIAVTSAQRSPELPDIPPIADTLPGYDATLWTGMLAPRGTPAPVIKRIQDETTKLLQKAEVRKAFQAAGTEIVATEPKTFGDYLKVEYAKWGKVVRELGLKAN